jgi:hypothetical protein
VNRSALDAVVRRLERHSDSGYMASWFVGPPTIAAGKPIAVPDVDSKHSCGCIVGWAMAHFLSEGRLKLRDVPCYETLQSIMGLQTARFVPVLQIVAGRSYDWAPHGSTIEQTYELLQVEAKQRLLLIETKSWPTSFEDKYMAARISGDRAGMTEAMIMRINYFTRCGQ